MTTCYGTQADWYMFSLMKSSKVQILCVNVGKNEKKTRKETTETKEKSMKSWVQQRTELSV